jgi:alpha-L-rhamnosidase
VLTGTTVVDLTTERRVDPLGIDEPRPRFGWRVTADRDDHSSSAFRIQVATSVEAFEHGSYWDTGEVAFAGATTTPYAGPPLRSRQRYHWRVKVVDQHGVRSEWSPTAAFEMGLLRRDDWRARWIGSALMDLATEPSDQWHAGGPAPYLRLAFRLEGAVARARAYVTALGLYELRINGRQVGDQRLTPGWTDYRHRIQYQTYDVTAHLRPGDNAIGLALADGWFAGAIGWFGSHLYGDAPAGLVQIEVELDDGRSVMIASDGTWRERSGPATLADLLGGEHVDRRAEPVGWDTPGFDDRAWAPVRLRADPGVPLVAGRDDGVRLIADLAPHRIESRSDGRLVVDFGQNITGHVRLVAQGPSGTTVTLRHSEILDSDGELYTANLRTAAATDMVTLKGGASEVFEPRFTFHGFRFAEISGYPGPLSADRVTARALSSAVQMIGSFECSDLLVNAIFRNAAWSLRDNFIGIPMDCPQRDERLGWAADAQIFAPSALFIADVTNTLENWLIELQDAQHPSGAYPDYAPTVGDVSFGNAGWADAGVLVPWAIFEATGDRRVLERQYASIRHYLLYLEGDQTGGIRSGQRYRDWVSIGRRTPGDLIGTAYLAHTSEVASQIARVLGRRSDAARWGRLARAARRAFAAAFVEPDGRIAGATQTGQALALGFHLLPERLRPLAADQLAAMVEEAGVHLQTGFLGLPLALPALSEHGYHELACRLVAQDQPPSWGFAVRQGATTIWERWNGWTPDAGFADPDMNSFNHYTFGAVVEWLVHHLVGLAPAGPGYRRVLIAPRPAPGFTFARAHHLAPHGPTGLEWDVEAAFLTVRATIPPNASGAVRLRDVDPATVTLDGRPLSPSRSDGGSPADAVDFDIGPGTHKITGEVVPPSPRRAEAAVRRR